MKQIDIYDIVPGNDYSWDIYLTNRNGYPLDLTGKTLTVKVSAFNDSIYEYAAAVSGEPLELAVGDDLLVLDGLELYITATPSTGLVTITLTADVIDKVSEFIHTYYLQIDDDIEVFGLIRPLQEHIKQPFDSPSDSYVV